MDHDGTSTPTRGPLTVAFRAFSEDRPGPRWTRVFGNGWPGWSRWLGDRCAGDPRSLDRAERALRRHMPELAPVWERLVTLAGEDPRAAQFLTFWCPPRFLLGCSQAVVVDRDGPMLIRNYDLDPALNEGILLRSSWLGRDVAGMIDGLSGLADGMNGSGLAASLAFGGRPIVGRGFGIPLILRYLLEVCADVPEAIETLRRLPCHMAYTVALIDREGRHAIVMLSPDRPAIVRAERYSTNHQLGIEWPWHARLSNTLRRSDRLAEVLSAAEPDGEALQDAFLAPPLHMRGYAAGFGTVYTAVYRPASGEMLLLWPGLRPLEQKIDAFAEGVRRIGYADGRPPFERVATPPAAEPDHRHHSCWQVPAPGKDRSS